jgi:hypothetical protein
MHHSNVSAALASEFEPELQEAARARSLRQTKRCLLVIAIFLSGVIIGGISIGWAVDTEGHLTVVATALRGTLTGLAFAAIVLMPLRRAKRWLASPNDPVRLERRVVRWLALVPFAAILLLPELRLTSAYLSSALGFPLQGIGVASFFATLIVHSIACSLLPLRLGEAFIPIAPFTLVSLVAVLIVDPIGYRFQTVLFILTISIGVALPGSLVCVLREMRFRRSTLRRALEGRYIELREDLDVARRIHDRLLPAPIDDGSLRASFAYEPMRDIGGDLVFFHRSQSGAVHVVLIDVTGHGIAAALLVNRLHGELLRIVGSDDDPSPESVLALLNDYFILTVLGEAMYATVASVRIDPLQATLRYASAAHPDLLIRRRDGSLQSLPSTACPAGALPRDCFDPAPEEAAFSPGETLLLFTDGLTEARDPDGAMLGFEGTEALLRESDDRSPSALLNRMKAYRRSAAQDDCIIVCVERPAAEGALLR